jgi:hypothetical protein
MTRPAATVLDPRQLRLRLPPNPSPTDKPGSTVRHAEHDRRPLTGREALQRLPQDQVVAADLGLVVVLGAAAEAVAGLDHGPPQHRAVAVDQDLAGEGGRAVVAADPWPGRPSAGHGVLSQLLGLVPVAGEQEPDPPQGPELAGEELQEVRVVACHASNTRQRPGRLR